MIGPGVSSFVVQHLNEINDAVELLDRERRREFRRRCLRDGVDYTRRYDALNMAGVILKRERDECRLRCAEACAPWFTDAAFSR